MRAEGERRSSARALALPALFVVVLAVWLFSQRGPDAGLPDAGPVGDAAVDSPARTEAAVDRLAEHGPDLADASANGAASFAVQSPRSVVAQRAPREYHIVTRGEDARPVSGARIVIESRAVESSTAPTDPAGRTVLRGRMVARDSIEASPFEAFVADRVRMRVRAPGFGEVIVPLEKGHCEARNPHEIVLTRASTLTVFVVDSVGRPVPGVDVRVAVHALDLFRGPSKPTVETAQHTGYRRYSAEQRSVVVLDGLGEERTVLASDGEGRCVFDALPARAPLYVEVLRGSRIVGAVDGVVQLAPGESREARVLARDSANVVLRFLDANGAPLSSRKVGVRRAEGPAGFAYFGVGQALLRERVTDARGRAEFTNLVAGSYFAGPRPDSDANDTFPQHAVGVRIDLDAATGGGEVEVVLPAESFVTGVVADVFGEPLAAGSILVTSADAAGFLTGEVQDGGAFRLGPLAPGKLTLRARDAEHELSSKPIRARAGDDGVELRLEPPKRLAIQVRTSAGEVRVPARIAIQTDEELHVMTRVEETGPGTYWIAPVPSGPRTIVVSCADGLLGVASISHEALRTGQPIPIVLEHGADLVVRVSQGPRRTVRVFTADGVEIAALDVAPGGGERIQVPAGAVELESVHPDGSRSRTSTLAIAGEITATVIPE